MEVSGNARQGTHVPLPQQVQRPFEVFVNGVPQVEGTDYLVRGGVLEFTRELAAEGKLGARKWTSMFLGVAGSYRRNDAVDVVYTAGKARHVASKLPFAD